LANDINATLNINTGPAKSALATAAKAVRDFNAVTDKSTKAAISQRAAMTAIAGAADKIVTATNKERKSMADLDAQAKKTAATLRNINLGGQASRSNGRVVAQAKADASAVTASATAQLRAAQTVRQGALTATEAIRQQIMQTDALGRAQLKDAKIASIAARDQIAASKAAGSAVADQAANMATLQYSLLNVAQISKRIGQEALGGAGNALGTAISFERQFANVKRTVEAGSGVNKDNFFADLNKQLVDLSQTLPISYEQLTEIASAAGQLGIRSTDISAFTETVAKFSATTDVSIDAAGTAFGRLNALIPDVKNNFNGLADSVLKVGVNSIATESQIIKIATQISSITGAAGFGYKATIGLSGALASIGAPPELSRGVITRTFGTLSRAIGEGGVKLNQFGAIAGMSGKDFATAWKNDAPETFKKFVNGLRQQGGNAENSLRALGITSVRDVPILLRLANAADSAGNAGQLLTQTMDDANDAAGTLNSQYALIAGTVDSKLKVAFNTIQSIFGVGGQGALGPLGAILDFLTSKLKEFADFASTGFGQAIIGIGIAVTGLIGVLALMVAAISAGFAGYIALIRVLQTVQGMSAATAASQLGLAGSMDVATGSAVAQGGVLAGLRGALLATGTAGRVAALGIRLVGFALKGLVIAGALLLLPDAMRAANDAVDKLKGNTHELSNELDLLNKKNTFTGFGDTSSTETELQNYEKLDDVTKNLYRGFANLGAPINDTSAALSRLDGKFADLAKSGDLQGLTDQINGVHQSTGVSVQALLADFDSTETAMKEAGITYTVTGDGLIKLSAAEGTVAASSADMTEGMDDAADAVTDMQKALADSDSSFIDLSQALADMGEAQKAAFDSANPEAAADAYDTFVKEAGVDLDGFIAKLQQQAQAQNDFEKNILTLRSKGVSDAGIQMLAGLGPAGAQAAAALATAGQDAVDKFNAAIEEGSPEATAQFAATVQAATPAFWAAAAALGEGAVAEITQKLADGTASVDDIIKQYHLNLPLTVTGQEEAEATIKELSGDRETGFRPYVNQGDHATTQKELDDTAADRLATFKAYSDPVALTTAIILMNDAAATRTANIRAQGQNVNPTDQNLDAIARQREAYINAHANTADAAAALAGLTRNRDVYIQSHIVNPAGGARELGPAGNTGGSGKSILGFASGGSRGYKVPGRAPTDPKADNRLAMLRSTEWVISQPAVDYYGDAFMNSINNRELQFNGGGQAFVPSAGSSTAGSGSGGVMELGPYERQLLVNIANRVGLVLDTGAVASATNARNTKANKAGVA
jgi:TP901 family phage tail tape measure protein